ncbi:hypothetical protein HY439_02940 [Candidatus Microgenomates bacterium]|nr:hypothetical protein [Candidatus Microgenomates bacterium]
MANIKTPIAARRLNNAKRLRKGEKETSSKTFVISCVCRRITIDKIM